MRLLYLVGAFSFGLVALSSYTHVVQAYDHLSPLADNRADHSSTDQLFSSDSSDSKHEAFNQGTLDEPAAQWAEPNTWLHAALSDTEREFLALTVSGTLTPNPPTNGGLTSTQIADVTAQITVTVKFNQASFTANQLTQLQSDIIAASGTQSNQNSCSVPTVVSNPSVASKSGGAAYVESIVTFTFSYNSINSFTAGAQAVQFWNGFIQSSSSLRATSSFQNIDLSVLPTFAVNSPTTGPTQTVSYCSSHATACLFGGTCIDGLGGSYSCSCAQGYIGTTCQYSLNFSSKRRGKNGVVRGRSVTKPNTGVNVKQH